MKKVLEKIKNFFKLILEFLILVVKALAKIIKTKLKPFIKSKIYKFKIWYINENSVIKEEKLYKEKNFSGIIYSSYINKEYKTISGIPVIIEKDLNKKHFKINIRFKPILKSIKSFIVRIFKTIKEFFIKVFNKLKNLKKERTEKKQQEEKELKEKTELILLKEDKDDETYNVLEDDEDIYEGYSPFRIIVFVLILLLALFGIFYAVKSMVDSHNHYVSKEVTTKQNNFDIKERIIYDGVIYRVNKVDTSMGTKYKKPKDGNHFIIIEIEFINSANKTKKYSYKNWKLEDSKKDETGRVFTPINVDTALYSGKLVVGAKKKGTIVFEKEITETNLKLNFYNDNKVKKIESLEKKEEPVEEETKDVVEIKEEVIKPNFTISIKLPKQEIEVSDN